MRLHVLFIIAALFALGTAAQDNNNAYNFLNVTPSSHVYALGGHNVSLVDDDINLVEQNPSLLGPEFDHQIGLSYMKYIGSTPGRQALCPSWKRITGRCLIIRMA